LVVVMDIMKANKSQFASDDLSKAPSSLHSKATAANSTMVATNKQAALSSTSQTKAPLR
jgi:hypothetical protein